MGCTNSTNHQPDQSSNQSVPREFSIGSKKLTPLVGFTIKFVIKTDRLIGKVNYKGKFFINLLHHDEIPTLVVGGKIRQSTDKSGSMCHYLDATINTQLFLQCSIDVDHRNYIISQIITIINDMVIVNKATLNLPYEYVLPNMKRGYFGDKINAIKKSDYHKYPVFPLTPFDKSAHVTPQKMRNEEGTINNNNSSKKTPVVIAKAAADNNIKSTESTQTREAVIEPKKEINYDEFLQEYFSKNEKIKEGQLIVGASISRPSGPAAINVVHKRVMILITHKTDYGRILFFHPQKKEVKGEFLVTANLKVHEKSNNNYEFEYDANTPPSILRFIDDEKNSFQFWTDVADKMNAEMAKSIIPKDLKDIKRNKRIDDDQNDRDTHLLKTTSKRIDD